MPALSNAGAANCLECDGEIWTYINLAFLLKNLVEAESRYVDQSVRRRSRSGEHEYNFLIDSLGLYIYELKCESTFRKASILGKNCPHASFQKTSLKTCSQEPTKP